MSSRHYPVKPLLGVCTAVWRHDRILLVRRGAKPGRGKWAMPGGLVEFGETLQQAAVREVHEETGLSLSSVLFNRLHEIIRSGSNNRIERHFVLAMFVACSQQGEAVAGDDAESLGWYTLDELPDLDLIDSTDVFVQESLKLLPLIT